MRDYFKKAGLTDIEVIAQIEAAASSAKNHKKRHIIFEQGQPLRHVFFLQEGLVRFFVTDFSGREHNKSILCAPMFIGSTRVMHKGGFSQFSAAAVNNVKLQSIDIDFWNRLVKDNLNFANFYVDMLAQLFEIKEARELSLLGDLPEARYLNFKTNFKDHMDDIPQRLIASYIGITPEALSRIRKRQK